MAIIGSQGFIDDGTGNLYVAGDHINGGRIISTLWASAAKQATWKIDPLAGNDNADGATNPVQTYAEITRRWGTTSPTLSQATQIVWLNDGPLSDPVICTPNILESGSLYLSGTLTKLTASTLGTVTAITRSAGVQFQANLGFSVAPYVGKLLTNTTHPGVCWIDADLGGNVAVLTQPYVPNVPAFGAQPALFPAQVTTFAKGDSFTISSCTKANIVKFDPVEPATDAAFDFTFAFINHLDIPDPTPAAAGSTSAFFGSVTMIEASCHKSIIQDPQFVPGSNFLNAWCGYGGFYQFATIIGGAQNTLGGVTALLNSSQTDGDVYLNTGLANHGPVFSQMACTYLAAGTTEVFGVWSVAASQYSTTSSLWGPGLLKVSSHTQLSYPSTQTAAQTFLNSGGITLGGFTASNPFNYNAATIYPPLTVTPAHIDAAVGASGFGGNAFDWISGACITKGAAV